MPSFTTQVSDLQSTGPVLPIELIVGSMIEDTLRLDDQNLQAPLSISAMVDTGARRTVIRASLVTQLNLKPVGATLINTPSSTNVHCYEYLTRLILPHNVIVESVVIAAPLEGQNIQCLIGRDVLRHGVLIYIGYDDSFTLSF
jgi:hypothetical protein